MSLKIKIFLFHRVSPVRDPLWNPITPRLFEQILAFLTKKYEIVPIESTLLGDHKPSGKKELCSITFDDGYKDYIDYAFPIMHKYGVPSSLYIVTECAEKNLPPWTYVINHAFLNTSHLSLYLNSKALPPSLQKTKWKNAEERRRYAKKLSPFLKNLNNQERQLIYEQILLDFDDIDLPENMMMNWDEIREVSRNGCNIGSHSRTHPLLTKRIEASKLHEEIYESGKKIEKELGAFPRTFSYPFGVYNPAIERLTEQAGYKIGMAVNNKTYDNEKNNLLELSRIELYDESFLKSRLRLSGILSNLNRMLRRERSLA